MMIEVDLCEINFEENDLRLPIFLNAKSPANFTVTPEEKYDLKMRILKIIKGDFLTVILHISGFQSAKLLSDAPISFQV